MIGTWYAFSKNLLKTQGERVKVFVCEFISGGGQFGRPDPHLLPEGERMAASLADDLAALDGVEVILARDPSLPPLRPAIAECRPVSAERCRRDWIETASDCDAAWIVAPETGDSLAGLVEDFTRAGVRVLGSDAASIRIAGSKLATWRALSAAGLPVIPTFPASASFPPSDSGWVAKPDDGAGADDMLITDDQNALALWLDDGRRDTHVVQPFIPGRPASISTLMEQGRASVLAVNSQYIFQRGGGVEYRGGIVGGMEEYRDLVRPLAEMTAQAMPGLWGPVGIDVILTPQGTPALVEINPRLTTPWTGLGAALRRNAARMVLDLAAGHGLTEARPETTVEIVL